jgi:hypothetical protein
MQPSEVRRDKSTDTHPSRFAGHLPQPNSGLPELGNLPQPNSGLPELGNLDAQVGNSRLAMGKDLQLQDRGCGCGRVSRPAAARCGKDRRPPPQAHTACG